MPEVRTCKVHSLVRFWRPLHANTFCKHCACIILSCNFSTISISMRKTSAYLESPHNLATGIVVRWHTILSALAGVAGSGVHSFLTGPGYPTACSHTSHPCQRSVPFTAKSFKRKRKVRVLQCQSAQLMRTSSNCRRDGQHPHGQERAPVSSFWKQKLAGPSPAASEWLQHLASLLTLVGLKVTIFRIHSRDSLPD